MKPFKTKMYILMKDEERVYWHNTFRMFCTCKENEFAFYTKEQAIFLKMCTTDILEIYEVPNFTLKKVAKI
jgi:hypothetical protein